MCKFKIDKINYSKSQPRTTYLVKSTSRLEVFCKKSFLRNFAKFTEKHLCQCLFFNKVVGQNLQIYQKETPTKVYSCQFCEISRNTYFTEHFLWLLLTLVKTSLYCILNTFMATLSILYPLKSQKNLCIFGVFRRYKMATLARDELVKI